METTIIITTAVLAVIFFIPWLIKLFNFILNIYYVHKLPGPPRYLFFGNMQALHDTHENIFKVLRTWGASNMFSPVYKLWTGPVAVVNILHPDDMALVLGDMKHNKKSKAYDMLHSWLGSGLLTSDGDKWAQRRKILTPTFHFTILQDFVAIFNDKVEELIRKLKMCANEDVAINNLITTFTLKVIGETAMGKVMDFNTNTDKLYKSAFHDFITILIHRLLRPYLVFEWIYCFFPSYYKEAKLVKILHNFTEEVIADREANFGNKATIGVKKHKRMAMLDVLLTAKNVEGIINYKGIREEVDTFMFEGHDTISSAICFSLMLIANHPDIQEEIVQEMKHVLGNIRKRPTYEDLLELKYMERCIKEALRMYPSVHYISRELGEDMTTSNGFKLKKETIIQLHIYDLHRNPQIYPDPKKFDPDRFLPENCKDRHPYAYIPFSAGPRNCIGQRFAILELKSAICGILGNFILKPVDTPESIVLVIDIILRTKAPIRVKFVPREDRRL